MSITWLEHLIGVGNLNDTEQCIKKLNRNQYFKIINKTKF